MSEWVETFELPREDLTKHPISIGRKAVGTLKALVEDGCENRLDGFVKVERGKPVIGFCAVLGEDEAFSRPLHHHALSKIEHEHKRLTARGDDIRDWEIHPCEQVMFPYDESIELIEVPSILKSLWELRGSLEGRSDYGDKSYKQSGRTFWEYHQIPKSRNQADTLLVFGEIATHTHFAVARSGLLFNRTAPILLLKSKLNYDDHVGLCGILNSSTACFWLKQVCFPKDGQASEWYERFVFNGTKLEQLPVSSVLPLVLAREMDQLSRVLTAHSPDALGERDVVSNGGLIQAAQQAAAIRASMISLQEELDWQCYRHYGLIDIGDNLEWTEDHLDALPPLTLGERSFEIRMARQMAAGQLETTWFERHKDAGSKPITELPAHWPDDYRALVERRLAFIEENKNLNLIERPEYKRRWNTEPWAKRQQAALEKWLLTRLEIYFHDADRMVQGNDECRMTNAENEEAKDSSSTIPDLPSPISSSSDQKSTIINQQSSISPSSSSNQKSTILNPQSSISSKLAHIRPLRARFAGGSEPRLVSIRQLAQSAQADSQWMEAATVFAGRADFDVAKLVETLVLAESVPALPAQRYKPAGLRKREEWEKTWELQRAEDAVEEEVKGLKVEGQMSEEELKKKIRKEQLARVGEIPVPPKYGSGDFLKTTYWKLRGKLDVPKERWVVYPGMEGGHDASPVIAWAGWDHAQQAAALTSFYQQAKDTWGWAPERLAPLLAALKELLPWLHQWHNAIDPEYGDRPCDSFQQFYTTELHSLRMTDEDIEKIRMGGGN